MSGFSFAPQYFGARTLLTVKVVFVVVVNCCKEHAYTYFKHGTNTNDSEGLSFTTTDCLLDCSSSRGGVAEVAWFIFCVLNLKGRGKKTTRVRKKLSFYRF